MSDRKLSITSINEGERWFWEVSTPGWAGRSMLSGTVPSYDEAVTAGAEALGTTKDWE